MSDNAWKLGFISRTREAREGAGFTQREMADYLGLQEGTYRTYELRRELPAQHIDKFCALTKVSLKWFLTGRGARNNDRS